MVTFVVKQNFIQDRRELEILVATRVVGWELVVEEVLDFMVIRQDVICLVVNENKAHNEN